MNGHSGRLGKRIACAVIVIAAGVGLGLSVHHDLQFTASVTTAKFITQQDAKMAQEQCIYNAIRHKVPEGVTLYTHSRSSQSTWWLEELSTPWAVPEADIADAQYRLTLLLPRGQPLLPFVVPGAVNDPAQGQ